MNHDAKFILALMHNPINQFPMILVRMGQRNPAPVENGGLSMFIPSLIGFQHVSTIKGDAGFLWISCINSTSGFLN